MLSSNQSTEATDDLIGEIIKLGGIVKKILFRYFAH